MKMKAYLTVAVALVLTPALAAGQDVPAPMAYSVAYTYDETSRLTGADIAEQLSIVYDYDASGRLLSSLHTAFSGVAVEPDDSRLPTEFALHGAYPNPFNPVTTVSFDLPSPAVVQIAVFDMLGRRVAILLDGEQDAGRHQVNWAAANSASGIYLIQMRTPAQRFSRTVLLLR